jgi:hypothetical protein
MKFHSCATLETLLISLSIEGCYLWPKNTVFWDAFMAISSIDAFWDFVPQSCSWNRHFGEHIAFIFRFLRLIGFHSCYHGITVDQPLQRGILFVVEENCLLGCFHGGINYNPIQTHRENYGLVYFNFLSFLTADKKAEALP